MYPRARLLAAAVVVAQVPPPAKAQSPADVAVVWYRSSDGCPDGEAFLTLLAARGVNARLANVQDSVDFVVTLGEDREAYRGRLERQTSDRIVAVREVQASRCQPVAEGIAFTLALALNPDALSAPAAALDETPASDTPAPTEPEVPTEEPEDAPTQPPVTSVRDATPPPNAPIPAPRAADEPALRWRLGARGEGAWGTSPTVLPQAGLFIGAGPSGASSLEVRVALLGGAASGDTDEGRLRVFRGLGRLEGCVSLWGGATFGFGPCIAQELGVISASLRGPRGRMDDGLWAASSVAARANAEFRGKPFRARPFRGGGLEMQVAALLPWVRYECAGAHGNVSVYQMPRIGLSGSLGVFFTLD